MYAKQENTGIKVYGKLPNRYKSETMNVVGGFDKLPDAVHQQEGFYPLVQPTLGENEKLGSLYFDEENQVFTYQVESLSEYEIAMKDWDEPSYLIRVTAPSALLDQYPSIAVWFQLNDLPIKLSEDGSTIELFMNVIKPQHQGLFDALIQAGEIQIENRPEEEDYL
jgi:hypothetical protein